ncbi:MAG: M48 family metallopeptidase [Armatimonadota bacterium]
MKRFLQGLIFGAAVGAAVVLAAAPAFAQRPSSLPEERPGGALERAERPELAVRVTPEMERYSSTRYALYFLRSFLGLLILLLFLSTGASARLRDLAERRTGNPVLRTFIYFPLLWLGITVCSLPLSFYSSYLLPHQYGLSNQTAAGWVQDALKGYALTAVIGSPVVALLYWSLRRSPRLWWVGFWVACIPLLIAAVLLTPLVVDPLFNRYRPLPESPLRESLLEMAERAGIENSRVFEVDASTRTKAVNAYVTGIGGSARIVLWDTLLEKLDDDEVVAVMAHEMGHYVERHVVIGLGASIVGTLLVFILVDRGGRRILARRGDRWRVRGLDDLAGFPLVLLLVSAINFFGAPVENAVSRTIERRADDFSLRLTGDGRAAASAFVKLSEANLSHPAPPPFIELWLFSHPPLNERIEKALSYRSSASAGLGEAPEDQP